MRKTLLATASGAAMLAAGPALSADMLSVGVGGYMQQWIGVADLDDPANPGNDGGVSQYSDSEIHFRGKMEADNGLTFSVKVEFEGNTHADVVDESQLTMSGFFGQLVLGSEDDPATLMHYGNKDVGVGLNCGDPNFIAGLTNCARSNKLGLGTSGHLIGGDSQKIAYYTPRMAGVQFGISYSPESVEDSGAGAPKHNDNEAIAVGLNFMGDMGDASIAVSGGYYDKSQTLSDYAVNSDFEKLIVNNLVTNVDTTTPNTANDIRKIDSQTFANVGLRVGYAGFGFDVAYAEHDGGYYKQHADDASVMVKDGSRDYEVVSVGANYTEGPMAVSLSHMMAEDDNDVEANASMFSFSYTLAPGIASRSTLMMGENGDAEGTALVTGITLSF